MADAKDFLFEIGTEEMPSAPLNNAVKQLGTMIAKGLDEAGLAHGEVRVISSPRRLAALVADVATATDEVHEVKRGPAANIAFDADGNATKAAQGFARKCGVAAEDLVRREDTDGREYVFAEKNIPSAPATPILTALCEKTIAGLQWPNYRSQRWGHEHATFVRPVRWICCLLGEDVVPVSFADVTSGNTTRGHRVLGPGDHVVASPAVYEQVLEDAGVLSAERRREAILAGKDEKFHSKSSGADKGESGPEIGGLEEEVPELFRLLERGEMVDIDHYQPRGGDESVALTTGKNAVGRYERQLSLFELAVFRYPAFPDEGA